MRANMFGHFSTVESCCGYVAAKARVAGYQCGGVVQRLCVNAGNVFGVVLTISINKNDVAKNRELWQ